MGYCPSCEREFEHNELLCPECGETLLAADRDTDEEGDRERVDDPSSDFEADDGPLAPDEWSESDQGPGGSRSASEPRSGPETARGEPVYWSGDFVGLLFGYPKRAGWLVTVVGGIAWLLGYVLLVPMIYVYGYAYRLGRGAARGDEDPPAGDDWGPILVDGLVLGVLYIALAIVGVFLLLVLNVIAFVPATVTDSGVVVGIGMLVLISTSFAFVWILGSILFALVGTGSVGETFSGLFFLKIGATVEYVTVVVVFVLIQVLMYVVLFATAITVVGILLWPFVFAYTVYMEFTLLGYMYNRGARAGKFDPARPDDPIALV